MPTISFQETVEILREEYYHYSQNDVYSSLFISDLWLNNISSPIQHMFFTWALLTADQSKFKNANSLTSYEDFSALLNNIYKLSPKFPSHEDSLPERDWGEIKFPFDNKFYEIFYSSSLEDIYDYLYLFQIIYLPLDKEFQSLCGRSPKQELTSCLDYQRRIIQSIKCQPDKNIEIEIGSLHAPDKPFWKECCALFREFSYQWVSPEYAQLFTCKPDSLGDITTWEKFVDEYMKFSLLPFAFAQVGNGIKPILPRNCTSSLLWQWSKVLRDKFNELAPSRNLRIGINATLSSFVDRRIRSHNKFQLVSIYNGNIVSDYVFANVIQSGSTIIFISVTPLIYESDKFAEELEKTIPLLQEAELAVFSKNLTLISHLREREGYKLSHDKGEIQCRFITVVPNPNLASEVHKIPEKYPGRIIFLSQFLGMVDEIVEGSELVRFMEYLDDLESNSLWVQSTLDALGSFIDSKGVIISGAQTPNFISLDPHWGDHLRYRTLSTFWRDYPPVSYFDDPRSWALIRETSTCTRLDARSYIGCALYCSLINAHFFTTSPFDYQAVDQAIISNQMMECLEDGLSKMRSLLVNHGFFIKPYQLHVIFFPKSVVVSNDKLRHLRHLAPDSDIWFSDSKFIHPGVLAIRFIFDDKQVSDGFRDTENRIFEVSILREVLQHLNNFASAEALTKISVELSKMEKLLPRFKIFETRKAVSFPNHIPALWPDDRQFKLARKKIAQLILAAGIKPGLFCSNNAKDITNRIRKLLVQYIDSEILGLSFEDSVLFLITRADAIAAERAFDKIKIKNAIRYDIDYSPVKSLAEIEQKFTQRHRVLRYLIEKLVQLHPQGTKEISKELFCYWCAFVDWLLVLYSASDVLHYGLYEANIEITSEFLLNVIYTDPRKDQREKEFAYELSSLELGIASEDEDKVSFGIDPIQYLEKMDDAFLQDMGFSMRLLVNILQIASNWPEAQNGVPEATTYRCTANDFAEICIKNIAAVEKAKILLALDFLTLKSENMTKIIGQDANAEDLPVWEYRKRPYRYTLRPFIIINRELVWGPYAAYLAGHIWAGTLSPAALPFQMEAPRTNALFEEVHKAADIALEFRATEIAKRYSKYVRSNLELGKLPSLKAYPDDLGDYDVLAFLESSNVLVAIECKNISPSFCLKDAKRSREKLFGRSPQDSKSYVSHVVKRHNYLISNAREIINALGWPMNKEQSPTIKTFLVSRYLFWWFRNPPYEIDADFVRIDALDNQLRQVAKS